MRVVNCMFSSKMGGMEGMSVTYIKAMLANGDDVHALYMKNSPYAQELAALGVHLHLFEGRSLYNPLNAIRLARLLRKINPELIFLHGNRSMRLARYPLVRSLWKVRAPMLGHAHNFFCSHLAPLDAIIATTRYWEKELEKKTGKNVFYLPNAVMPEPGAGKPKAHTPPVIGAMGRLHDHKAFDVLLDAAKIMKDNGRAFKIVIAGEGPARAALLEQRARLGLEGIVDFPGWITDKKAFYDQIDFFCLSSRTEAFGIVILEAMLHAAPIVSTVCAGPAELLEGGKGLLVPIDDPAALAAALQQFLDDPARAFQLGEETQKATARDYGFEMFCRRLKQIQQMVGSPPLPTEPR